jgi:hypothetical protein
MMRRSTIGIVVLVALVSTAAGLIAQSSHPWMGTWKVDVAKSTYSPGPPPKSNASKWEPAEGGATKITIDGIDGQGQATHTEIIMKFDGKDYPLKGAPSAKTTRAYKRIDDRTFEYVEKVDGKETVTFRSVASRDGKTRTATTTGKDVQGRTVNNVAVWVKQ